MQTYDVVVIGGGPAAITIAKNLKNKKAAFIRPEDHSMIYCAMPYVIEKVLPFEKSLKKDKLITDAGGELIRDRVVSVSFEEKTVSTEKGAVYGYEKLIIATGADPIIPPLPGTELKGVLTFKTEQDLTVINTLVENGLKQAVVVGAGAIGVELSQALARMEVKTSLVDMTDQILPNMVDYEMVEEAEEQLIKAGVDLHLKTKVVGLHGTEVIERVELENGKEIHFDSMDTCSAGEDLTDIRGAVFFAVGMRPNVDIFKDTELHIERDGIVVNSKMETNIKDVYAVGDCTQYTSAVTGDVTSGKLATNAVPMARLLAKNINGENREYMGFFNGCATKIEDRYIGGTGLTEKAAKQYFDVVTGYSEFTTAFPIMPFAKKVQMKLVVDRSTRRVVGGQVVSGEPVTDKIDVITMAIQFGIPVDKLVYFSYSSQPYQSFFPANHLIVQAAERIVEKLTSEKLPNEKAAGGSIRSA